MAQSTLSRWSKLATDPIRNFRFLVEFSNADGDATGPFNQKIQSFVGGFSQVSGLGINTASIAYREGGMNTTLHQVPGMTSFQPITLQRGAIWKQDEAMTWMRGLFAAASGEGIPNAQGKTFRVNLTIYVLDHPAAGAPLVTGNDDISEKARKMKFIVHNAWISGLSYSDLNAQDNQIMFETIQLVHEGLSVSYVE